MKDLYKNIKFVGLVARNGQKQEQNIEILTKILEKYNIQILLESSCAKELKQVGFSASELAKNSDFIISLGGDGTLISTCRTFAKSGKLILGIHAGTLGFLTDITINECEQFFSEFFKGNYEVESPNFLELNLVKNGKSQKKIAFNDVVLARNKVLSIAHIDAFLNGKHFNSYFGDGVIVSSAVGSTAYNMSSGGAIIYPLCDVFSLTPICSHSLTQRPLILPKKFVVRLQSRDDVALVIDGQDAHKLDQFDYVEVGISELRANLIRHLGRDYFGILKQKLRWGSDRL